jgi:exosortase E/protease (VPEID-CTERM system)
LEAAVSVSKPDSIMRALVVASETGTDLRRRRLHLPRLPIFAALAVGEIFLGTALFDFDKPFEISFWQNPLQYANMLAKIAVVALPLLAIVAWPRRQEIAAAWHAATAERGLKLYLAGNLALFAALLLSRFALSRAADLSVYELAAYSGLLLATGASMALVAAPPSFWRRLLKLIPTEVAVASAAASVAVVAGRLAQNGWDSLSSATLNLSHWFLTLYEQNVVLNAEQRILQVGDFGVQVYGPCSGYEGVTLISAFLPVYMWVFRRELRFPNVLLLFPIGIAAMWTLNALRIAVLVSIGSHFSPTVAVQGFHSEAGWISFLAVTLGCIAVSRKVSFFAARPGRLSQPAAASGETSGMQASLVFLAPFMALVAASILASAFAPHDQWLYAVKVVAIGAVLWWFRAAYLPLITGASLSSVAVGLVVGVAWIATDPGKGSASPLGPWLASLPLWLAVVWLGLRAFGSIALVPVAEELAFRGYLSRVLISAKFEDVAFGQFRLLAFVGSSVAFGLMHQRWVAACLAGAIYALLMYRTKKLSDPIAAHVASNAAIMFWAVAAQQWTLL